MSVTQLTTYSLTLKRIREQFDLKRPNTTFYAFAGNFPNFDPENVDLGWKDKVHSIFPRQLKALCSPNESFDGIINTKNELGYLGGETKTGYYAHGGNLITVPEFSDGHVYIHDDPYVIDWIRRLTAPGTGVFTGTLDIYGVSALPSTENFGFVQAQKATVAIELQHVGPVLIGPAPYNGYSTVYSANFYIRLYDLFRNYGVHHSPYGDSTLDDTWTFTGGGSPTDGEITFHPAYGVNPAWVEFYSNKGVPFTFRINDYSIPGNGGSPVEVQTKILNIHASFPMKRTGTGGWTTDINPNANGSLSANPIGCTLELGFGGGVFSFPTAWSYGNDYYKGQSQGASSVSVNGNPFY